MKCLLPLKITTLFIGVLMFFAGFGIEAGAATGEFNVANYATGMNASNSTSQRWRGYVFTPSQDLTITNFVGGGWGVGHQIALYTATISGTGTSTRVNPTAMLGRSATTTSTSTDAVVGILFGNYPDDTTKISLTAGTRYLFAIGMATTTGANNNYTTNNININNLIAGSPIFSEWMPVGVGAGGTFRWDQPSSNPSCASGQCPADRIVGTQSEVAGVVLSTMPLIGFQFETDVVAATVETLTPTFAGANATMRGSLTETGNGTTTTYIEWGTNALLSSGTTLIAVGTTTEALDYATTTTIGTAGTYYYRAVAINAAGREDGDIQSFTAHSLAYSAGAHGSLDGVSNQIVFAGQNGSTVEAIPDPGFAFIGWNDEVMESQRADMDVSGNMTATALFFPAITFDPTGGSAMDTIAAEEGSEIIIPAGPTRSGYTFVEWNTDEDGGGEVAVPGDELEMPAIGFTLYARWQAVSNPTLSSSGGSSGRSGRSVAALTSPAATLSQVYEQIRTLLAQIVAGGGSLTPSLAAFLGSGDTTTPMRDLELGLEGSDVTALQTLLITQGYSIPAGATGFFGEQTRAALSAYQAASAINPAAGYFGSVSRAFMKTAGLAGLWW